MVLTPCNQWRPLSIPELRQTLADASFTWALAGGYAIEQFVGAPFREHGDIDVLVFRDEQLAVQRHLSSWRLFAADPPGMLRAWEAGEYLELGIHDIWGHRPGVDAWELQLMLAETAGDEWFSRRDPRIRGPRRDLIVEYGGIPCLRVEVQLLYKAKHLRPKDEADFRMCLPRLSGGAREWLGANLRLLYPNGHPWIALLS